MLVQCQNCQDNHEEDCVINVIRLCLELALFGDNLDYEGNTLSYLVNVSRQHPQVGATLLESYKARKNLS